MCSCEECLHENDQDRCPCAKCVRVRDHGLECACEGCIHAQGYPLCHCVGCCVAFGIPRPIAKVMAEMADGVLHFLDAKWLVELPEVMPVGMRELIVDGSMHLRSIPTLPEGLEILRIHWPKQELHVGVLPSTLKKLEISNGKDMSALVLPRGLEELVIYGARWNDVKMPSIVEGELPCLRILKMIGCKLHELPPLPCGLKELDCAENFIRSLPPLPTLQRLNVQATPIGRDVVHGIREGLLEFNHSRMISLKQLQVMPDSYICAMLGVWERALVRSQLTHMYAMIETLQTVLEWAHRIMDERNKESQVRCMSRCTAIKRDLMENRWHPRRIGPLIEAGWDVEDI
jgi:hypothetical protein